MRGVQQNDDVRWWRRFKRYDPYRKLGRLGFQDTTLFLTLALWLCTFPLLSIFAVPFLGWRGTLYLAGFLLVAELAACWILCQFRLRQTGEDI